MKGIAEEKPLYTVLQINPEMKLKATRAINQGVDCILKILLLMDIEAPSDAIKNAIRSGVTWFKDHQIEGIRLRSITNSEGKKDREVVKDANASPIWARFYDLDMEQPYFCDRDGIKRKNFSELGYERRNGYSWYTTAPAEVFNNFSKWAKKWDES